MAKTALAVIVLMLLLYKLSCAEIQLKKDIFPHRLWLYWNTHIDSAPMLTKLCINAIRKTAESSNWQFVLLNSNTIHDYLSDHANSQIQFIQSKTSLTIKALADLYRLFLVYQHGGMWLDTNSFFVRDLSWIEGIDREKGVYNKLSLEPEMIMFSYNEQYGGNKTIVFDERIKTDVVLFPGLEIWAFIAKPKAKFLRDVLANIVSIYRQGSSGEYMESNRKRGYQYGGQDIIYFLFSNHAFQTTLQQKQREIQANPDAFMQRYAIQYYNIWCIDSIKSAFQTIEKNQWLVSVNTKRLFYMSLQESVRQRDNVYFIKLTGQFYTPIILALQLYKPLYCLDAVTPIPENSVLNKFLLQPNQQSEFVKQLREIERKKREGVVAQCEIFNQKTEETFFFYLMALAAAFAMMNAAVCCLVRYCCTQTKAKTHSLTVS